MSPTRPVVASLTLAHGRHHHLRPQLVGLLDGTRVPDLVVVAAMDDPGIPEVVESVVHPVEAPGASPVDAAHRPDVQTFPVPRDEGHLPLARARNAAAERAIAAGAELLVFLDVDCLPSPRLVQRYAAAWAEVGRNSSAPVVLSGAVHYLPSRRPGQDRYDAADLAASLPHPARPVAPEARCEPMDDLLLFWSLSFAMSATHWQRVGGFDEGYRGYGGEDTDFALRVQQAGGRGYWVGGAAAYHQHHAVDDPPRQHVADIVRNSNRFHERWGFFPMSGWLDTFEAEGLVTRSGRPPRLHLSSSGGSAARSG